MSSQRYPPEFKDEAVRQVLERLLADQFSIAERHLKDAILSMASKSLMLKPLRVVVHPEDKIVCPKLHTNPKSQMAAQ